MSQMPSTHQGWNPDPFRRFEQRWFSQGTPTALVRNGRVESQDDPMAFAEAVSAGGVGPVLHATEATAIPRPVTYEYRIYRRRRHRWSGRIVLTFMALVPIVGLAVLVPSPHTRMLILADYAILSVAIAALVGVFRLPRRWSKRA